MTLRFIYYIVIIMTLLFPQINEYYEKEIKCQSTVQAYFEGDTYLDEMSRMLEQESRNDSGGVNLSPFLPNCP